MPALAYHKSKACDFEFSIADCTVCNEFYTCSDFYSSALKKNLDSDVIRYIACSPVPLNPSQREELFCLLLRYQVHQWRHVSSCFKKGKRVSNRRCCRFMFPKLLNELRSNGNQYVNPYNDLIMANFKCNHDIKFLYGGGNENIAYYCLKYVTKAQKEVEDHINFYMDAFDKSVAKQVGEVCDEQEELINLGRKRISSMMHSLTSKQETAAPLAHLHLLNGTPFYWSHSFLNVSPSTYISQLWEEGDIELSLTVNQNGIAHHHSVLLDYIHRPYVMENMNLNYFLRNFKTIKWTKNGIKFLASHPSRTTLSMIRLKFSPVLVFLGKQYDALQMDDYSIKLIKVMFSPFRSVEDLHRLLNQNWIHENNDAAHFHQMCKNYQESRKNRQMDDQEVRHYNELAQMSNIDLLYDTMSSNDEYDTDGDELNEEDNTGNTIFIDPISIPTHIVDSVAGSIPCGIEMDFPYFNGDAFQDIPNKDIYFTSDIPDSPTIVEFILENRDGFMYDPDAITIYRKYPTILATSNHFKLNKRQHQMFVKCALALLVGWAEDEGIPADIIDFIPITCSRQSTCHLVGPAGYGKSEVIKAITDFARMWERPDAVMVCAFTGSAAQNAGGTTIHSLFGWSPLNMNYSSTLLLKTKFARVKIIIIDEISAVSQSLVGYMNLVLKDIRNSKEIFGGLHSLLVGDWLQLPPTAGNTLFSTPKSQHCSPRELTARKAGLEVWDSINYVRP